MRTADRTRYLLGLITVNTTTPTSPPSTYCFVCVFDRRTAEALLKNLREMQIFSSTQAVRMTGPHDHPGWLRLLCYRCHATHPHGERHVPNADINFLICNNSNLLGKRIIFLPCHTDICNVDCALLFLLLSIHTM